MKRRKFEIECENQFGENKKTFFQVNDSNGGSKLFAVISLGEDKLKLGIRTIFNWSKGFLIVTDVNLHEVNFSEEVGENNKDVLNSNLPIHEFMSLLKSQNEYAILRFFEEDNGRENILAVIGVSCGKFCL